jgi:5-oxoprolinase (ATP-hydrolysing) subunit C
MTATLRITSPGPQATVQDWPGRLGRLADGVSAAGPFDHLAHRLANLLVGNDDAAATLEITLGGLRATFSEPATIALTGTDAQATLDGDPIEPWASHAVQAGAELRLRMSRGPGFRAYLAVAGGIATEPVLGSRATHTLAAMGGLDGRALAKGDELALGGDGGDPNAAAGRRLRDDVVPEYRHEWEIDVIRGPQADPDYLTAGDVAAFLDRPLKVDANSNRLGLRLEPASFSWARRGGGIAGGHPSNILDDGYPPGGINMNGDTPVVLGPDGPTSGGFVVIATVVQSSFWRLGQVRPGADTLRLREVTVAQAAERAAALDALVSEDSLA